MSAGRFGNYGSEAPLSAVYDVNRFASERPSPLLFSGTGERRDEHAVVAAKLRAEEDRRTLRRLAEQGLDARQTRGTTVTPVDLATMGEMVGEPSIEVRRTPVFHSVNRREQREAERDLRSYLDSLSAVERGARRLIHVRLRPRDPADAVVQLDRLREAHRRQLELLGRRLAYVRQLGANFVVPLAVGVHHRPVVWPGDVIDLHFHVALDVVRGADVDRALAYLGRHYTHWEGDPRSIEDVIEGAEEDLAGYLRDTGARHVETFGDQQLATYVRQVHGLHRYQTLGPLRRHIGQRSVDRIVCYRPRRRSAAPGTMPSGPTILRATTAWFGTEKRPALLVRNWNGQWSDLADRYDLDLAVTAARVAVPTSTFTAAIPKSSSPLPSGPPDPCTDPPPEVVQGYPDLPDPDIPW